MNSFYALASLLFYAIALVKLVFVEQRVMSIEEVLMSAIFWILCALYQQNEER